jgi:2-polyprenyl-3-methyl-5-hydroxy-6-metoxy-1,4-benzoquinol methylase
MIQKQNETFISQINAYTTIRHDIVKLVPCSSRILLDVGCSDGTLGAFLKQLNPAREVDGIEINGSFCEIAKVRLNTLIQADLNKTSLINLLPKKNYDCIIFADVLEHLIEPENLLRDAINYLGPNGVIIISLPNIRHITALYSIYFQGTFPRYSRGLFDQTHLRWFTINDAINFINASGVTVVK